MLYAPHKLLMQRNSLFAVFQTRFLADSVLTVTASDVLNIRLISVVNLYYALIILFSPTCLSEKKIYLLGLVQIVCLIQNPKP
jgi:predicted Kef-type K+ transport protein